MLYNGLQDLCELINHRMWMPITLFCSVASGIPWEYGRQLILGLKNGNGAVLHKKLRNVEDDVDLDPTIYCIMIFFPRISHVVI